jgi:hypothetical protein
MFGCTVRRFMSQIHREGLLFKWITKDYQIVIGFRRIGHGHCKVCNKRIAKGNTICDQCFEKEKNISKK